MGQLQNSKKQKLESNVSSKEVKNQYLEPQNLTYSIMIPVSLFSPRVAQFLVLLVDALAKFIGLPLKPRTRTKTAISLIELKSKRKQSITA